MNNLLTTGRGFQDPGDLLASIKLLIKKTMAVTDEMIITETRIIPGAYDLPMAPVRGFMRPRSIRKVSPTAIWARTRFPFRKPGVMTRRMIPAMTGIRAVTEGVAEESHAQPPKMTRMIALRRFIKYGFMNYVFKPNSKSPAWFTGNF